MGHLRALGCTIMILSVSLHSRGWRVLERTEPGRKAVGHHLLLTMPQKACVFIAVH